MHHYLSPITIENLSFVAPFLIGAYESMNHSQSSTLLLPLYPLFFYYLSLDITPLACFIMKLDGLAKIYDNKNS